MPVPAILKPQPLWTGKQAFSCLLPKMNYEHNAIDFDPNLDAEIKSIRNTEDVLVSKKDAVYLSGNDSKVVVRKGELLLGHLCKQTVGNTHNSLIHVIIKNYGCDVNKTFMRDLQVSISFFVLLKYIKEMSTAYIQVDVECF